MKKLTLIFVLFSLIASAQIDNYTLFNKYSGDSSITPFFTMADTVVRSFKYDTMSVLITVTDTCFKLYIYGEINGSPVYNKPGYMVTKYNNFYLRHYFLNIDKQPLRKSEFVIDWIELKK